MADAGRLEKSLTLFDVYAISTGAMFSSGFFLLPGLAFARAGPAVALAYGLAGLAVLPPMLSMAELSTAMPRAGGAYYFLDRALGPLVGTVGGLGTWFALILKTAFALIGMGAYLALVVDLPIQPVALALTLLFVVLNIVGAKESSGLQRVLVVTLVTILGALLFVGFTELGMRGFGRVQRERFDPFLPFGAYGLVSTVGLVFVSYAGLTKVASIAEEVERPDRNLPLGMILSLLTATAVYVGGVWLMVALLPAADLTADLTPVATIAAEVAAWLPGGLEIWLVLAAAVAAFASTGNAGILSASRYLLAMGRDRLVPPRLAGLGRFRTPTAALWLTGLVVAASLLLLDVEGLAKLASAFQLVLFSLLNLAVIVMRESEIEAYDPGFRSPLYPWMQIAGFLIPVWLILEMGWLALGFTIGMTALAVVWYFFYAHQRLVREGAIYHVFARLGRLRYEGLDREFRQILKEKEPRDADRFEELVTHAPVLETEPGETLTQLTRRAAARLAAELGLKEALLADALVEEEERGWTPVGRGAAIPHARLAEARASALLLARCRDGMELPGWLGGGRGGRPDEDESEAGGRERAAPAAAGGPAAAAEPGGSEAASDASAGSPDLEGVQRVEAVIFVVSPADDSARHLRILARIAGRLEDPEFLREWRAAENEQELKEALVHSERLCVLRLRAGTPAGALIGRPLREAPLHQGTLVVLISREDEALVPTGGTVLREGDRLTILGERDRIRELRERFEAV